MPIASPLNGCTHSVDGSVRLHPAFHPHTQYGHTTRISNIAKCQLWLFLRDHCVNCVTLQEYSPDRSGRRAQDRQATRLIRASSTVPDGCAVTGVAADRKNRRSAALLNGATSWEAQVGGVLPDRASLPWGALPHGMPPAGRSRPSIDACEEIISERRQFVTEIGLASHHAAADPGGVRPANAGPCVAPRPPALLHGRRCIAMPQGAGDRAATVGVTDRERRLPESPKVNDRAMLHHDRPAPGAGGDGRRRTKFGTPPAPKESRLAPDRVEIPATCSRWPPNRDAPMNCPDRSWQDPDDEPRTPSRLENWHRLPWWAFWVLISLSLLAFVLPGLALTASLPVIR